MPFIPLSKPIAHDGKTWDRVEMDPSLGALEAFEAAIADGKPELSAMIELIAADGDTPLEVARGIRTSDLAKIREVMDSADPTPPSAAGGGGGDGPLLQRGS